MDYSTRIGVWHINKCARSPRESDSSVTLPSIDMAVAIPFQVDVPAPDGHLYKLDYYRPLGSMQNLHSLARPTLASRVCMPVRVLIRFSLFDSIDKVWTMLGDTIWPGLW